MHYAKHPEQVLCKMQQNKFIAYFLLKKNIKTCMVSRKLKFLVQKRDKDLVFLPRKWPD
jgi:hypothetical protein